MPFYPPVARGARVQGKVFLLAKVNQDGEVTHAEVIEGHPLLKDAALAKCSSLEIWLAPSLRVHRRKENHFRLSDV